MKGKKEKLERKIKRIKNKIESLKKDHGNHPSLTHTYHAGWDLGYYQGRLSVLEDKLDEMNEKELSEEDIQNFKNTTVVQLAQQLEDGLLHGGWLHEETSVLEFIKNFLNK